MKVLHYSLGFPPYRSGGLVKFCIDLMKVQKENGIDVAMIWPGRIKFFNKNTTVIESKDKNTSFKSFELVNPLPVSLDEGINQIELYTQNKNVDDFEKILEKIKPDYIHIHTLMGLPKEFIVAAKKKKIKTIFTTHDYFGICPKVTLFYNNSVCVENERCHNCYDCNKTALSYNKIKILQSPLYRLLKNSSFVKILRKKHRKKFFSYDENNVNKYLYQNAEQYIKLREYYLNMLKNIDLIHFNSSLAQKIYSKYIDTNNSKIINISHQNIQDNRKIKGQEDNIVKIGYLASTKPYKGYFLLKESLKELWNEGKQNFILNVYEDIDEDYPFIKAKGNYKTNELNKIFRDTDILIAPSIWYETYGYTVLEAISYGVPVIITENVGAKDIVGNAGIIVKPNDKEALKNALRMIIEEKTILERLKKETLSCRIPQMQDMLELLEDTNE